MYPVTRPVGQIISQMIDTPPNPRHIIPRRLFSKNTQEDIELDRIDVRLEEMNVELLLINSLMINAVKVQMVIENFIKNKDHTSIFCLTETKVDSLNFKPIGIKIFSKHRMNE